MLDFSQLAAQAESFYPQPDPDTANLWTGPAESAGIVQRQGWEISPILWGILGGAVILIAAGVWIWRRRKGKQPD